MTKWFHFGTTVLKICISRLLDLFSHSQLVFWSLLLFSKLLRVTTSSRLFFYALSHERYKQTQWEGKWRRGLPLFPRSKYLGGFIHIWEWRTCSNVKKAHSYAKHSVHGRQEIIAIFVEKTSSIVWWNQLPGK